MFRSYYHLQGAHILSCYSYNLKHSVNYFITLTLVLCSMHMLHSTKVNITK